MFTHRVTSGDQRGYHIVTFELRGHLRATDTRRITNAVISTLRAHHGQIAAIFDFHDAESFDSAALGAIVTAYTELIRNRPEPERARLVAVRPKERLGKLFRVAKIIELFEWFTTEEQAMRALANQRSATAVQYVAIAGENAPLPDGTAKEVHESMHHRPNDATSSPSGTVPRAVLTAHLPNDTGDDEHVVTFSFSGHVKADHALEILTRIKRFLSEETERDFILDLEQMRTFDSATLGALVAIYVEYAQRHQRPPIAIKPKGLSAKLLYRTKVVRLYEWYDNLPDATNALPRRQKMSSRDWNRKHLGPSAAPIGAPLYEAI